MFQSEQLKILEWAHTRKLEEIAIELTGYCNLSCALCSVWRVQRHGLTFNKSIEVLSDAYEMGARKLVPCGAECFVRKDFLDILEYAVKLGYTNIPIVTNGLLLSDPILERLRYLPSVFLNSSLDGPRTVHDDLRGPGTYDRLQNALKGIASRGIRMGLSSVIMRQTLETLSDVVDVAVTWGITSISLQPFQPEIAGSSVDHSAFSFSSEDLEQIREKLAKVRVYANSRGVSIITEALLDLVPNYLALGERPDSARRLLCTLSVLSY